MVEPQPSPRDEHLYYSGCLLTGVRADQWKLVLPRPANPPGTGWWGRMIKKIDALELYDLAADPGETTDVAARHPGVVAALLTRIAAARTELGDIDITGRGARLFEAGPRLLRV